MEEPSVGEFDNWKTSPTTQWFFNRIRMLIGEEEVMLASGSCLRRDNMVETQTLTAESVGRIEGCRRCLDITPEGEE